MQIDRIYYPIKTLGFGNRIGLWTIGCEHRCAQCANPELWEMNPASDIPVDDICRALASIRKTHPDLDGVTISGGEPFLQPDKLLELVLFINRQISEDILVYSGFTIEELSSREDSTRQILRNIAVLVDGKYIEALNDNRALRGSANQRVIFLKDGYEERYRSSLNVQRTVQHVYYQGKSIYFGIPLKGWRAAIVTGLKSRGVLAHE